jgi:hypothetical protein
MKATNTAKDVTNPWTVVDTGIIGDLYDLFG